MEKFVNENSLPTRTKLAIFQIFTHVNSQFDGLFQPIISHYWRKLNGLKKNIIMLKEILP